MPLPPGKSPAPSGSPYPYVGPNYLKYGEQYAETHYYDYTKDQYFPKKDKYEESLNQQGVQTRPEEKGTDYGQVATVAGVTGGATLILDQFGNIITQKVNSALSGSPKVTPTGGATGSTGATGATSTGSGATGGLVQQGAPDAPNVVSVQRVPGSPEAPNVVSAQQVGPGETGIQQGPGLPAEGSGWDVQITTKGGETVPLNSEAGQLAQQNNDIASVDIQPSESGGFNYAQAMQAAATIAYAYGAYRSYEKGDYVGAGIGAAGAGTAAYNLYTGGNIALWPFAVALTMWGSYKGASDAKKAVGGDLTSEEFEGSTDPSYHRKKEELWADIGLPRSPGGLMNDAIGLALGYKSKKSDRIILRDRVRRGLMKIEDELQRGGFRRGENDAFEMQLADGSYYNIGRDGGEKVLGYDGKTEITKGGEVDTSHPLSGFATGLVAPVMATIFQGKEKEGKAKTGFEAQFINGIISNAGEDPQTVIENARKLYYSMGLDSKESMYQFLEALAQSEDSTISQDELAAYENAVNIIFDDVNGETYNGDLPIKPQENVYGIQQGVVQGETAPVQNAPGDATGGLMAVGGEDLQVNASPGPVNTSNPQGVAAPAQQQAQQGTGQPNQPQISDATAGLLRAGSLNGGVNLQFNPVTKYATQNQ